MFFLVFCCQGGDARGDDLFPLFDICSVEGVAEAGGQGAYAPPQILAE